MADWEAEGLLDGLSGRDRAARVDLLDTLQAEGCGLQDIKRAHRDGELLFLLAGRAIGVTVQHTWADLLQKSGVSEELAERLSRAQGVPRTDDDDQAWYTTADLELLRTTRAFVDAGVPEDDAVAVGRLLGRGFSQAAEVMRNTAMRMILEPGLDERELAVRYARTAGLLTPMLEPLLGNLLKLHLSKIVQTELISAEEREAGRLPGARPVVVAFADLVGFTRLGESVPPDELGAVADRLEGLVLEVIEAPVRFVKTLGDAVMLVCPDSEPMLEATLAMTAAADAEGESFPQLRAGVAAGEALGRAGDWFGRPVNLASRVTAVARPGSVLATDQVRASVPESFRWSKAGIKRLKNVEDPVPLWRVRWPSPAEASNQHR